MSCIIGCRENSLQNLNTPDGCENLHFILAMTTYRAAVHALSTEPLRKKRYWHVANDVNLWWQNQFTMWFEIRVSELQYEFRVCQIGDLIGASWHKNSLRLGSTAPTNTAMCPAFANLHTKGRIKYGVTRVG